MNDEEFAQLTAGYVAATEARLAVVKTFLDATTDPGVGYRELADREWELGQAWDAEVSTRSTEHLTGAAQAEENIENEPAG